ncbi:MAG: hypothetical protein ACRDP1_06230 [Nocardioidaceae bacterium]
MRMSHRRRRLGVTTVVLSGALLVSGCGSFYPGSAARIGDTTVSMDHLDNLATAYCQAFVANGKLTGSAFPVEAGVAKRRQVLGIIEENILAKGAAAKLGVTANPADYTSNAAQISSLLKAMPAKYRAPLLEVVTMSSQSTQLEINIGDKLIGGDPTKIDTQTAQKAGQQYVTKYAASVPVTFDPRFGVDRNGGLVNGGSGSLSAGLSSLATAPSDASSTSSYAASLPPSQVCG